MDLWLFYIPDFINYADYFFSFCCHRGIDTERTNHYTHCRAVASGGAGGALAPSPHFFAKQLTLSQPGGQIIRTTVLRAPLEFQTLRRACSVECTMELKPNFK